MRFGACLVALIEQWTLRNLIRFPFIPIPFHSLTTQAPGPDCVPTCSVDPSFCDISSTTIAPTTAFTTTLAVNATTTTTTTTTVSTLAPCAGCYEALQDQIASALKKGGGVGLGFSFLEAYDAACSEVRSGSNPSQPCRSVAW